MAKRLIINLDSTTIKVLELIKEITSKRDAENIEDAIEVWAKRLLKELIERGITVEALDKSTLEFLNNSSFENCLT